MSLSLNAAEARKSDNRSSVIKETGKYVGVITRAEKLKSHKGTEGVGLSFKTDDGASANYLDVYTVKPGGEKLWGHSIIQSLLCCVRLKDVEEGPITFDKWDSDAREMVKATAPGYPSLIGKRVGLLLQRELGTNPNNGADTDRVNIVRVFEAATGLTASEILDGKTKPEKLDAAVKSLVDVYDKRKKSTSSAPMPPPMAAGESFDQDIPF